MSGRPAEADVPAGHASSRRDRSVPPAWLEPVLRPIERLDRRLRRIRPIRPGGILGLELARHRGRTLTLRDGTLVRPGDLVGEVHLDNARTHEIGAPGWQAKGLQLAWDDLRALAAWADAQTPDRRPVAYHGETVLAALARRVGFEVHELPADAVHRLRAWYLRGLLARWAASGRNRLAHGRGGLRVRAAWLSDSRLREVTRTAAPPGS
jgi:hypothetical protein